MLPDGFHDFSLRNERVSPKNDWVDPPGFYRWKKTTEYDVHTFDVNECSSAELSRLREFNIDVGGCCGLRECWMDERKKT